MLKSEALQLLEQKIAACTKCIELVEYRKANNYKTVPGIGNANAEVMVIGEAPGQNEAEQGEPFIGKAGRLLTNILEAAGWAREDIFICNILKCRPPGNRDPLKEEADNCRKFLDMQIRCIDPKWILCFGRIASVYLLERESDTTIGSLRGEIHDYQGHKVICTYHPSYLLRQPAAKKSVWEDIQPAILALQPQK
jgi:DNA polymerase